MSGRSAVVTCSALKEHYRRQLLAGTRDTRLVYLRGTPALIEQRLWRRRGYFFDVRLLASQFATLEEPDGAVIVDVDADLDVVVSKVLSGLELEGTETSDEEREQ